MHIAAWSLKLQPAGSKLQPGASDYSLEVQIAAQKFKLQLEAQIAAWRLGLEAGGSGGYTGCAGLWRQALPS